MESLQFVVVVSVVFGAWGSRFAAHACVIVRQISDWMLSGKGHILARLTRAQASSRTDNILVSAALPEIGGEAQRWLIWVEDGRLVPNGLGRFRGSSSLI
ncbi:MAG: hypothetical protein U0231_03340 [Nitrospiraceae bacterium]